MAIAKVLPSGFSVATDRGQIQQKMNVCWVTCLPLIERDQSPYSIYAGVRLRTLLPARAMQELGHASSIVSTRSEISNPLPQDGCQAAVFDQLYPFGNEQFEQASEDRLELIARCQRGGIKAIADIHDDHFRFPERIDYYRRMLQLVDMVVVNTYGMKEVVAGYTSRPIEVIGDPYEGPSGEPSFSPVAQKRRGFLQRFLPSGNAPRLKLLWFGHQSNLKALYDFMPQLASNAKWPAIQMTVVSGEDCGVEETGEIFNHYHGSRCRMGFVPWSLENTWNALRNCDLCVLPVDTANKAKSVKSANRLIETIRAGRFAIASPLPAYQELSGGAWIGENLPQGIEWALDHPAEVVERIREGQRAIEQHFSPMAIGKQWERMLFGLSG